MSTFLLFYCLFVFSSNACVCIFFIMANENENKMLIAELIQYFVRQLDMDRKRFDALRPLSFVELRHGVWIPSNNRVSLPRKLTIDLINDRKGFIATWGRMEKKRFVIDIEDQTVRYVSPLPQVVNKHTLVEYLQGKYGTADSWGEYEDVILQCYTGAGKDIKDCIEERLILRVAEEEEKKTNGRGYRPALFACPCFIKQKDMPIEIPPDQADLLCEMWQQIEVPVDPLVVEKRLTEMGHAKASSSSSSFFSSKTQTQFKRKKNNKKNNKNKKKIQFNVFTNKHMIDQPEFQGVLEDIEIVYKTKQRQQEDDTS